MNFFQFLIKKVFKSKFNLIPLALLAILTVSVLFLNFSAASHNSLQTIVVSNLGSTEAQVEDLKNQLKSTEKKSDIYSAMLSDLQKHEIDVVYWKSAKTALDKKEWSKVYENINKATANFRVSLESKDSAKTMGTVAIESIQHDYLMYRALESRGLAYEVEAFPTKGISFTVSMAQFYFPIVFVLGVIFILTSLFTGFYVEGLNLQQLNPRSKMSHFILSVSASSLISGISYLLLLFMAFGLSSLIFGIGSLNYPIYSFHLENQMAFFQNIGAVILPSGILTLLVFVVISEIIYLLAYLLRERLATLFVSLLLISGISLATNIIEPFQRIAQYMPTTYINSISVVTGQYAHNIQNYSVSFQNGLLTLGVSSLALFAITQFVSTRVKAF